MVISFIDSATGLNLAVEKETFSKCVEIVSFLPNEGLTYGSVNDKMLNVWLKARRHEGANGFLCFTFVPMNR